MKKLFIILLLFCFYVNQAWGAMIIQQFTSGGGSCDTEVFSETAVESNTYPISNNSTSAYIASMFLSTATKTVCGADVYLQENGDLSGSSITMTVAIYSNSCSTCDRTDDSPGSIVTADSESDSLAWSSVDDGGVTTAYSFTGMSAEITSSTLYWIVFEASNYDNTNYPLASGSNAAVTEEIMDSSDGSSWDLSSATRSVRFVLYE